MRIMGIDGSLSHTGIAIVEGKQVIEMTGITTSSSESIETRLYQVIYVIQNLIDKNNVKLVVLEDVFVESNRQTAIKLARLNGALLALCKILNVEVILCMPTAHKLATTGNGQATKEQTIEAVEKYFNMEVPYLLTPKGNIKKKKGIEQKNDNIADALSLCCWYIENQEVVNDRGI